MSLVPAVALLAPVCICSAASAQPRPVRTALAVQWSSEDYPSNPVIDGAIRRVLLSRDDAPVDYFSEYLESDRFPEEQATLAFRDYLQRKYQGRRIDVVVAITDPALQFVLQYRDQLFPGVPIIAAASSTLDVHLSAAGVTGTAWRAADVETIELALSLHPSTERVFVIVQELTSGYLEGVRAALAKSAERVEVRFIQERTVPDLIAAVRAVPAHSVIHFIRFSRQDPGNVLFPLDVVRLVAEASPVPVYSSTDSFVGTGVVGGMVRLASGIGMRVGEMALQVLDGTLAQDIPIEHVPSSPIFDWRQVQRWGIDASRLPPGSEIRFRVPTAWELYRWYIVAALTLVAVQGLMIASLVVERSRRRESQKRYALATAAGGVGVWDWNLATNEIYIDPFLKATLGYADHEIGNYVDDWSRLSHPDDATAVMARAQALMDGRSSGYEMEHRLLHRDGHVRWFLTRGSAVTRDGRTVRVVGTETDITARKMSEQALDDAQAELARVSRLRALGEFAASIAHEVRQPLTSIILNAKTCQRWLSDRSSDLSEVQAALSDIVDAGQRAEEQIRRNRDLFGHSTVQKEPIDIDDLVRNVAALAGPQLKGKQITLTTSLASTPVVVTGDRVELQQVLLNLLLNSIDATENVQSGLRRIEILTSLAPGGAVKVAVRDNGVGLKDVDMRRLFSFSYTTKVAGTGIGLSLSRSIVQAHGGRLWAEQNDDGGATFSFTIPVDDRGADNAAALADAPPPPVAD
jgi:PAS domain S-box-containing protein